MTSTCSRCPRNPVPTRVPCLLSWCHCGLKQGAKRRRGTDPTKGCSSPTSLCDTPERLRGTQRVAEGAESVPSCWRDDSGIPLHADEANKGTCVFGRFFANGLQMWWVSRDDNPLPGEMSRLKASTLVWHTGRLGGKSPTSTASESLLRIFGLSTNSTHKTSPEKLLKEESRAWNPGDFTCKMFQASPLARDALLSLLSIWVRKMVLHHAGQQCGTPLAQAQHTPARNKRAGSCTHTRTSTHT